MFALVKFHTQACSFLNTKMFPKFLLLVLLVGFSEGASRTKRADIDLQTCIDNFDIHRDKIIRTQDSKSMGANYLTEFDLGTREECLRLCCETDNCDVFVFEEKNSGGCYLFHCGPPEDFKCKFTHHVNYSSAVLAINRHLPDLESQIKLTKHEQDLSQLRKPIEPIAQVAETRTSPSTTSSTTEKPKQVNTKPAEEGRKCSRNQFECRSTSECIAIYNACDGIPQCADGSDEAPELGCPAFTTPVPPPVRITNPIQVPRFDNIPPQQLHPLPPALSQSEIYRPQIQQVQRPPSPDFLRPLPNPRPYENPQLVQYGPAPAAMQPNSWVQHQAPIPAQAPSYTDKNSHIFNHKENGLQVPDGQEISQMQYSDQYGPKANYYESYREPAQQETWPGNPEEVVYNNAYPPQDASGKDWHQKNMPSDGERRTNQDYKTPPASLTHLQTTTKDNSTHEQDKMAHELKFHAKQNVPEPKIKIEKHKQERYPDVTSYKMVETSEDGAAETASGAVLSLTLGLIITCVMALLIGCRLRVRRRLRKAGKSYAHDADYLVNGMYL